MVLRYLPFRSDDRIVRAAQNTPPLKQRERGNAVAILQQALIDYGYPMPGSTGSGAPDGIYGRETTDKVAYFQGQNNLGVDGIAGRNSFACLDLMMTSGAKAQRSKKVTLHFRSLTLTNVPFANLLRSAQQTYAQYNIEIAFGSGQSARLSEAEATKFERLDGECNWVITAGEYKDLLDRGTSVPRNHISVFFVNRFSATILGCGGHLKNHPACIVARDANRYDMAHEVGHVLLTSRYVPVHHVSQANLMHETASSYANTPVLDQKQVAKIKSSPLCM